MQTSASRVWQEAVKRWLQSPPVKVQKTKWETLVLAVCVNFAHLTIGSVSLPWVLLRIAVREREQFLGAREDVRRLWGLGRLQSAGKIADRQFGRNVRGGENCP